MKDTAKIESAKQGMANMAIYLHQAYKEEGYTNPKAEMIKGISESLGLLKEEEYYIHDVNPSIDANMICNNILEIVEDIEKSKKLNAIKLRQIKQSVVALKTLIRR